MFPHFNSSFGIPTNMAAWFYDCSSMAALHLMYWRKQTSCAELGECIYRVKVSNFI